MALDEWSAEYQAASSAMLLGVGGAMLGLLALGLGATIGALALWAKEGPIVQTIYPDGCRAATGRRCKPGLVIWRPPATAGDAAGPGCSQAWEPCASGTSATPARDRT